MLRTIEAVVLALQPHSDKAHLLHAYTREEGRTNFLVYGLGRKHAAGLYSPLAWLRITADFAPDRPASLRTAQMAYVPLSIASDPYKQTIALFISEVLFHTLRHPMQDEEIFDYLTAAVCMLDKENEPQNFHLQFLLGLAERLGFAVDETLHPELYQLPLTRAQRQEQLRRLCAYMAAHVETWQPPKSLDILAEVFD